MKAAKKRPRAQQADLGKLSEKQLMKLKGMEKRSGELNAFRTSVANARRALEDARKQNVALGKKLSGIKSKSKNLDAMVHEEADATGRVHDAPGA